MRAILKGLFTNFEIMFYVCISCMFKKNCIPGSPTCVRFELVKSPEVTCAVDGAMTV